MAVPVLKCDFCSSPEIRWRYPCKSFVTPTLDAMSNGDWAACDDCRDLVESGKYHELAAKTVKTWPHKLSDFQKRDVTEYVLSLQALFRAYRSGPAIQLTAEN